LADTDVEMFTKLGLTSSQAKIYLTAVTLGQSTARAIAKKAQMDRSQTYNVISTLEKLGIVRRIIASPAKFDVVPVVQLMSVLIERKKRELSELEMRANLRSQHYWKENFEGQPKDEFIMFIPDTELNIGKINESDLKFKKTCHAVTTMNIIDSFFSLFEKNILTNLKNEREIILIQSKSARKSPNSKKERNIMHQYPNFRIRFIKQTDVVPLAIYDDKEVWINLVHEDEGFFAGKYLFSNNPNLVTIARRYFDQMYAISSPAEIIER
jgi:sugar-specific transcriptional regulator TrmB